MKYAITLLVSLFALLAPQTAALAQTEKTADDYKVVVDEVRDGVRFVEATMSETVCSTEFKVEINVEDKTIKKAVLVRGCPGNGTAVCKLLEGMTVDEAVKRLKGTPCGKRVSSCPDQMARILSSLKW